MYIRRSHWSYPKYAQRTAKHDEASHSSTPMTHAVTLLALHPAHRSSTPSVMRGFSPIKGACEGSFFLLQTSSFLSKFCLDLHAVYTPKPRYYSRAPKQVPKSRGSREVRFPSRSPAREEPGFCEDLPDLRRNTTSASRSAARSSSDQVSV